MSRIQPLRPARAYKTYQIVSPPDRTVKVACELVWCEAWLHGWETAVDEGTDLGRAQAEYIRTQSGRTFRERRTESGLTVFRFESKQRCFADHKTRPERYSVRLGDWRPDGRGPARTHTRAADWVEDFGLHQQRVADQQKKG
ncbi:MAG: hypothetical protein ACRDQ0_12635 [Pseudonocardia sp.]